MVMAKCDYCGSTILFGGKRDGTLRFCNDNCHQKGSLLVLANKIPSDVVQQLLNEVHTGTCPKCGGPEPVDVHTSHNVMSFLIVTRWGSKPQISCRSCGFKSQLNGALTSFVLGWWGLPWGIIITPIQIIRNVVGMFGRPDPAQPSLQLQTLLKMNFAAQIIERNKSSQNQI
jgi:hypothetical protein